MNTKLKKILIIIIIILILVLAGLLVYKFVLKKDGGEKNNLAGNFLAEELVKVVEPVKEDKVAADKSFPNRNLK